jgi:cyclopropane fatty-acyl-phospholipid synthase-like methyltransferase
VTRGSAREAKRIVEAGYDVIAERYLAWSANRPSEPRLRWLARALELIPADTDVLDLGCGAGVPMTQALANGRRVTGVDISTSQLERARSNVPSATFVHADMTAVDFPPESFDAVVSFYALTHVPRAEQPELLARIRSWLRPGGVLVATMGAQDAEDEIEEDWLGVPMFFSHYGVRRNRAMVRRAGFEIDEAVVCEEPEDRDSAIFLWVVAHAPRV